jgi:hypothetical protein
MQFTTSHFLFLRSFLILSSFLRRVIFEKVIVALILKKPPHVWIPKVHKIPLLTPVLSQMDPVNIAVYV